MIAEFKHIQKLELTKLVLNETHTIEANENHEGTVFKLQEKNIVLPKN